MDLFDILENWLLVIGLLLGTGFIAMLTFMVGGLPLMLVSVATLIGGGYYEFRKKSRL